MNKIKKQNLHKAQARGKVNTQWLTSYHSFSFGNYFEPQRMGFGMLRVLNDDTVEAGMGFGTHPHKNMEIISIPLEGDLEHKDSIGNKSIIRKGDVQVMSAGSGIYHSEYNSSNTKPVKFLQIWITPNQQNVEPRYDQITINEKDKHNTLLQIVSPLRSKNSVWIYQQTWFYIGTFDKNYNINYQPKNNTNGIFIFVIKGEFIVNNESLSLKDSLEIYPPNNALQIQAKTDNSEILIIEVPMQ